MINENMKKIAKAMIDEELARALNEHGEFHSIHEAWAVMKEEVEELEYETNAIIARINMMWLDIKDGEAYGYIQIDIDKIMAFAINAICEAVQVAAMANKAKRYLETEIAEKEIEEIFEDLECVDDVDSWAKRKSELEDDVTEALAEDNEKESE